MHRLLTGYAVNFNHRHKRSGHLFQNRYCSILCQAEEYFQQLVRYIHRNPLRAGLVKTLAELDRYPWCGHSGLMGNISRPWQAVKETLGHFGGKPGRAGDAYRQYMAEAGGKEEGKRFLGGGLIRSAGGWEAVKALGKAGDQWAGDERILGEGDFVEEMLRHSEIRARRRERWAREGWNYNKVVDYVSRRTGVEAEKIAIKGKGKAGGEARALVAYLCRQILGMRVTEIGEQLGVGQPAASQLIAKGRGKEGKLRLDRM